MNYRMLLPVIIFVLFFFSVTYAAEHEIDRGETALQIAIDHDLTMEQLQQLNPGVDLEMMHIGDILVIPDEGRSFDDFLDQQYGSLAQIRDLNCRVTADHSAVCLFTIENRSDFPLFDVHLRAEVRGQNNVRAGSDAAIALMQVLPGEQLPVYMNVPGNFDAVRESSVRIVDLSRSELLQSSFRIPAELYTRQDSFSPDGIAVTSMIRFIPEAEALYSEKMINILAAAWDTDGNLAGVRSLYSDFYSRMDITVYSIGPAIDRVELFLEAY